MDWYYVENGQQAGPVDEASLAALVSQGRVNAQTLVWNATLSNWQPYGEAAAQLAAGGVATELPAAPPPGAQASAYCAECGRPFPVAEMVQYGGACVCAECKPTFFQKIKEGVNVSSQLVYAGFWIRLGAKIIDGLVMMAVMIPMGFVFGATQSYGSDDSFRRTLLAVSLFSPLWFVSMTLTIGYYVFMNGKYGQTLGKMACGIRIVRSDGQPITFGRAFGRFWAENFASFIAILKLIVPLASAIMVGVDEQKRAIHDHICDTRVVYK